MVLTQSQLFYVQEIIHHSSLLADQQFVTGISTVVVKAVIDSMQTTFNAVNAERNEIESDNKIIKDCYGNLIEKKNAAVQIKFSSRILSWNGRISVCLCVKNKT